ncbi:dTMP kinase [Enterovirga sp.]|uniref:dTMP kinase n=1 Tax=Enterovirga sp. TaxID=2026350 RepID=UPI002604C9D1|nr:dTMP kinase [Enterovirga sp.]MDB5590527.1 thymidylate kinase [Enterovirga sp.]
MVGTSPGGRAATATPPPGRFVTFEGGEGAGKSTQIRRLARRLAAAGIAAMVTREPGGSPRAELIREALLAGRAKRFGAFAEALLFGAARADHVGQLIAPALARGDVVLCDRFLDSTRVYQGDLAGVSETALAAIDRAALGDTRPDLTLVLDLPAETGLARAAARREGAGTDRFEAEDPAFHAAIRHGFLRIAACEPDRCRVVDATGTPEEVEARIWAEVAPKLAQWGRLAHAG